MQFRVKATEPLNRSVLGGDMRIAGPFCSRDIAEQTAVAFASDGCQWAWINIEQADDPLGAEPQ